MGDGLYTVHATISPEGEVERTNMFCMKPFFVLNKHYSDKMLDVRLLVVSRAGEVGYYVIDLWGTEVSPDRPYSRPGFVEVQFEDIDQACGWCALNVTSLEGEF